MRKEYDIHIAELRGIGRSKLGVQEGKPIPTGAAGQLGQFDDLVAEHSSKLSRAEARTKSKL